MWSLDFHRNYRRIVRQRRKEMKTAGGILKLAAYLLSDKEIFDDEVFRYLNAIAIEIDLCGPKSIIGSCSAI